MTPFLLSRLPGPRISVALAVAVGAGVISAGVISAGVISAGVISAGVISAGTTSKFTARVEMKRCSFLLLLSKIFDEHIHFYDVFNQFAGRLQNGR